MNKIQKQNGFAVVETALLLLILVIIIGTGYYVWHSKKQTDKSLNTAAATNLSATNSKSKKSVSSSNSSGSSSSGGSQSGTKVVGYLVISQWGIKLPLTSDISDAVFLSSNAKTESSSKTTRQSSDD